MLLLGYKKYKHAQYNKKKLYYVHYTIIIISDIIINDNSAVINTSLL